MHVDQEQSDPPSLRTVVETLLTSGLVTHTLSEGGTKFTGVCRRDPRSPFRQGDTLLGVMGSQKLLFVH